MSDAGGSAPLLSTVLFLFSHLAASLVRPIALLSLLCIVTNPAAAFRKCSLFKSTFLYLLLCKDKKWKAPVDDPASFFPGGGTAGGLPKENGGIDRDGNSYRSKTIVFIRHGESTWNDTFNKGDRGAAPFALLFVPMLIYAFLVELYFFVSGRDDDSWFFDSALSGKGVRQSEGLRNYLRARRKASPADTSTSTSTNTSTNSTVKNGDEWRAVNLLLGIDPDSPIGSGPRSSRVVSSNLRRAVSTAAIGLSDRLARGYDGDDVLLLPCLQEISKNPDALSILPPRGTARPTWCDRDIPGVTGGTSSSSALKFGNLVDSRLHDGNKPLSSNGLIRMRAFCELVFSNPELSTKGSIVAAGHSLWFKSFFATYLPRNFEHISKKKKLVNGGTAMFTLREVTMKDRKGGLTWKEYVIDPDSLTVVYGGFGKHTKS